jgi:hypothetical protein
VKGASAIASEPRYISPSPYPIASGAAQLRQCRLDRLRRAAALFHLVGDEMGNNLAVGLGRKLVALFLQFLAQLAEILDDAVVHHRNLVGRMRMRVYLVRLAVRGPARVSDAGMAGERLAHQPLFEVLQLAFGAAPRQVPALERGHARRIVAAVFKALERLDHFLGDRLASEYSDDSAHPWNMSPDPTKLPRNGFKRR